MGIFDGKEHLLHNTETLFIRYLPKDDVYTIVDVVLVKQDNGDWKKGVCYQPLVVDGATYVRTLDQFPSDKWRLEKMY